MKGWTPPASDRGYTPVLKHPTLSATGNNVTESSDEDVNAETLQIVQSQFDNERDPVQKAALGGEITRLKSLPQPSKTSWSPPASDKEYTPVPITTTGRRGGTNRELTTSYGPNKQAPGEYQTPVKNMDTSTPFLLRMAKEAVGAVEPALTMATGTVGAVLGHIGAGLTTINNAVTPNDRVKPTPGDVYNTISQGVTYQPRTDAGARNTEDLGTAFKNTIGKPAELAAEATGYLGGSEYQQSLTRDLGNVLTGARLPEQIGAVGKVAKAVAEPVVMGTKLAAEPIIQGAKTVGTAVNDVYSGSFLRTPKIFGEATETALKPYFNDPNLSAGVKTTLQNTIDYIKTAKPSQIPQMIDTLSKYEPIVGDSTGQAVKSTILNQPTIGSALWQSGAKALANTAMGKNLVTNWIGEHILSKNEDYANLSPSEQAVVRGALFNATRLTHLTASPVTSAIIEGIGIGDPLARGAFSYLRGKAASSLAEDVRSYRSSPGPEGEAPTGTNSSGTPPGTPPAFEKPVFKDLVQKVNTEMQKYGPIKAPGSIFGPSTLDEDAMAAREKILKDNGWTLKEYDKALKDYTGN